MRKAFVKALCEEASKNDRIFLLTGDLGYNILEEFQVQFPDRFLNVSVAEANLVTVAAGLSTVGFIPCVYSIATFMSMRPFEQIRNDVSLQKLNVKIIGVGAGFAYTKAGSTHHAVEDIALMRTLPNITIISPSDPYQAYLATKEIMRLKGPTYMRLERNPDTDTFVKKPFSIEKGILIQKGNTIALLSTGAQIYQAMKIASELKKFKFNPSVFSFPTIKPLDKTLLKQIVKSHSVLVTLEEHSIQNGFGTAILEFYNDARMYVPVLKFGIQNNFSPISTDYYSLIRLNNFSPNQIVTKIVKYFHK